VNSGGDSGDESRSPLGFFRIQMALVFGVFASLNFPQYAVNGSPLQGKIPIGSIHRFLNLFESFAGSGEAGDEVSDCSHGGSGDE